MKTVMGWIDKIVSSLAKRKVNKDEGRVELPLTCGRPAVPRQPANRAQ